MKLTAKKIKILSEGQQAKYAILEKYGSIEQFIKENDLKIYAESVKNYIRRKKITSDSFKYYLTIAFSKGFNEIILDRESQINRYVDNISMNIELYSDKKDIEVLDKLKNLCIENKMTVATARMYRATAMYNFYRNNITLAIEQLRFSIDMLHNRIEKELLIEFYCDLGYMYYYIEKYDAANKIFDEVELRISKEIQINNKIIYTHYYRRGLLYNDIKKYEMAKQAFETCLQYEDELCLRGMTILNIGTIYKRQGKYKKALSYYNKAVLNFGEENKSNLGIAMNYIAEIHKIKGNYEIALEYIRKSLECFNKKHSKDLFISMNNYIEISILNKETQSAMDMFMEILLYKEELLTYKKYIINCVNAFVSYGIDNKDTYILNKTKEMVLGLLENSMDDKDFKTELKACLCDIFLMT